MNSLEESERLKSLLQSGRIAVTSDVEAAELVAAWLHANPDYKHIAVARQARTWVFGPKDQLYPSSGQAAKPTTEELYRPMAQALIKDRTYALNFRVYDPFCFYLLALEEAQKLGIGQDRLRYRWEETTILFWVE